MNVRYVPGDRTFFDGIRRLPPGHVLEVADRPGPPGALTRRIDWTPDDGPSRAEWMEGIRHHYRRGRATPADLGRARRRVAFGRHRLQLRAGDGPPGPRRARSRPSASASTSRGTRPTTPASWRRPSTTDHHELVLHEPALAYLADAIRHTEEPKVNSLQLYLLHRFIGEHVTVVLSGLGGDELFAGYDFYGTCPHPSACVRAWSAPVCKRLVARPRLGGAAGGRARPAGAGPGDPQDGMARLHPATGARHYLLLRNAWDFNPVAPGRVYTPEFAGSPPARDQGRVRRTISGWRRAASSARRCGPSSPPRWCATCCTTRTPCRWRTRSSRESRCSTSSWSASPPASRTDVPVRQRPQGPAQGGARRRAARPRARTRRNGASPSIRSSSTGRTSAPSAREMLTPGPAAAAPGCSTRSSSRRCWTAKPHQRLRWHYFMLWQMIGVEMWQRRSSRQPQPRSGTAPRRLRRSMTPMKPEPGTSVETVREFWQSHVNNEYYTEAARGSDAYFREIEQRRYAPTTTCRALRNRWTGGADACSRSAAGSASTASSWPSAAFGVTAVDLTENALEIAERVRGASAASNIDFRLGNAEGLDFPDAELRRRLLLRRAPPHARHQTVGGRSAPRAAPRRDRVRDAVRPLLACQPRSIGPCGSPTSRPATETTTARSSTRSAARRCAGCSPNSRGRVGSSRLSLHLRIRTADDPASAPGAPPARPGRRMASDDHRGAVRAWLDGEPRWP